jgi:hypothetical protein
MSMRYRCLDENWDYRFGRQRNDYLTNIEAVAQAIKSRLKLLRGEWWEDPTDGLPLWQEMLGKRTPKGTMDRIIQERILGTTNVREIAYMSSSYDPNTRAYTFYSVVDTIYGQVVITNQEGVA